MRQKNSIVYAINHETIKVHNNGRRHNLTLKIAQIFFENSSE